MTSRGRPRSWWFFCIPLILSAGGAHADDLLDLANAELHLPTVCPSNATVGIYGSLTDLLITEMWQTNERQNGDISLVERARLDDILAEHALAPYLDPATAPAADGLLFAEFVVLAEADLSGFPIDLSVRMARSDTQAIVYERSWVVTESDGFAGLEAAINEAAQDIASIAASGDYACPRIGSLTYTADMSGNEWSWNISGYFDVIIRDPGNSSGDHVAIIRHVPTNNQVSGLLLTATGAAFPTLPAMNATPQFDTAESAGSGDDVDPQGQSMPTGYLIQFPSLGAVGPKHLLVFAEGANPILATGKQNELEFPNMAAVALGQWMRRDGGPSLQLNARVTGSAPISWTIPAGQGTLTLTWVLP